jgi:hypothetical protein
MYHSQTDLETKSLYMVVRVHLRNTPAKRSSVPFKHTSALRIAVQNFALRSQAYLLTCAKECSASLPLSLPLLLLLRKHWRTHQIVVSDKVVIVGDFDTIYSTNDAVANLRM